VFVCLLLHACCLFALFVPLSPLLLCVLACCMFALFMPISSSLPCSPTCYLFALFTFAPPLSRYVCAYACLLLVRLVHAYSTIVALCACLHLLLLIRLVHACFAIVALRACFLLICLVHAYFAIVPHLFLTCSPCSHLFHHHHVVCLFLLTCYMFALFMFVSPLLPVCLLPIHLVRTYFAIVSFWPSRFRYQVFILPSLPYVLVFTYLLFKYKFAWFVKLALLVIHLLDFFLTSKFFKIILVDQS
jgi:hypothetical protein